MKILAKNTSSPTTKTLTQGLLIATLLFAQFVSAQEAPAQSETAAANESLEEVIVTGQKSLLNLRFDMLKAEDVVYDIYNDVYAGTEFEMVCDHATVRDNFTGLLPSALKRVCTTSYVKEENSDALQASLAGFDTELDFSEHNAELKANLLKLYSENASFRASVDDLAAMRNKYKSSAAIKEEQDDEEGFFKRLFSQGN